MGVKAVVVKSFARIHETNLKKQGVLALLFNDKSDYDVIQEDDFFEIKGLTSFAPNVPLILVATHSDGSVDEIVVNHTFNDNQIEWFKAGSALNLISQRSGVNA
jgi:aconitate hydratase